MASISSGINEQGGGKREEGGGRREEGGGRREEGGGRREEVAEPNRLCRYFISVARNFNQRSFHMANGSPSWRHYLSLM